MAHHARSPNHFLASLSEADFESIRPDLRTTELLQGTVLVEAGAEITRVYFPHDGVISLIVRLERGETVEAAMVGADGCFGAGAALDGQISLNAAIVQLKGSASTLDVAALRRAADESASLRALLIRHEQVILAQALQAAACNATHTVQARLSRWLLRARDLSGSDTLNFTQEFLAQMLGAQRNAVSIVANTLQQAGLIRYRRGKIEILNPEGLAESSCECYAVVKGFYARLLNEH
jgi:CRP-like cAMP-binding protein